MSTSIVQNSNDSHKQLNISNQNIETRIANRAKSIFAAFGTIVNDFYLGACRKSPFELHMYPFFGQNRVILAQ